MYYYYYYSTVKTLNCFINSMLEFNLYVGVMPVTLRSGLLHNWIPWIIMKSFSSFHNDLSRRYMSSNIGRSFNYQIQFYSMRSSLKISILYLMFINFFICQLKLSHYKAISIKYVLKTDYPFVFNN